MESTNTSDGDCRHELPVLGPHGIHFDRKSYWAPCLACLSPGSAVHVWETAPDMSWISVSCLDAFGRPLNLGRLSQVICAS